MTTTETMPPSATLPACAIDTPETTVSTPAPVEWTAETIWRPDSPEKVLWPNLDKVLGDDGPTHMLHLSDAYFSAVASETSWEPLEKLPTLPKESFGPVGRREVPCPLCRGGYILLKARGRTTGVPVSLPQRCSCSFAVSFWGKWMEMLTVHPRFADANLRTVAPDTRIAPTISIERQQEIIDLLKAHRNDSFLLVGPPETGKTHLATCLYQHAVADWAAQQSLTGGYQEAIWRITAAKLLDEHHEWVTHSSKRSHENEEIPVPTVTVNRIQLAARAGYRPRLFLDEVDKIVPTDFKLMKLIQIIDAVYEAQGQIVATTNKAIGQLTAKWGSDEAGTALRRIGRGEGAHMVVFAPK